MTFYIDIRIEKDIIYTYAATRTERRFVDPGCHEYLVRSCPRENMGTGFVIGCVKHRYEDGAAVLALKVLKIITPEDEE